MSDAEIGFGLGLIAGLLTIFSIVILLTGINSSPVDIDHFGKDICESHGLVFKDWHWKEGESHVPVIVCEQNKTVSIYDGVVVKS